MPSTEKFAYLTKFMPCKIYWTAFFAVPEISKLKIPVHTFVLSHIERREKSQHVQTTKIQYYTLFLTWHVKIIRVSLSTRGGRGVRWHALINLLTDFAG